MKNKYVTIVLFFVLSAIILLPILYFKFQPLGEYPNHLLNVFIAKHYSDPSFDFRIFLSVDRFPYPNLLGHFIVRFFSLVLPVAASGKAFLALYLVGLPLSIFFFLDSLERKRTALAFISFLLPVNAYLHMGFLNYLAGLPCYFFALGLWERLVRKPSSWGYVALMILGVCVYFSGVVSCLALISSLIILAACSPHRVKNLTRLFVALIPSATLLVIYLSGPGSSVLEADIVHVALINKVKGLLTFAFHSYSKTDLAISAFPFLTIIVISALVFLKRIINHGELSLRNSRYYILFLCLLVLYFASPSAVGGSWPIDLLLLPYLFVLPLCLLTFTETRAKSMALYVVVFSLLLAQTGSFYSRYRSFDSEYRSFEEIWRTLPSNAILLPIVEDAYVSSDNVELHRYFWTYYHLERGGIGPYFFAYPRLEKKMSSLVYRDFQSLPNPGLFGNDPARTKKAISSKIYDVVAIYGECSNLEIVETNYSLFDRVGELSLYERKKLK